MKQSNFLKTRSLLFVVMAITFAFASCSSDKDEPNGPDDNEFGGLNSISYSILPGKWIIESIKDSETGKVIPINRQVTIESFSPVQTSSVESKYGYQLWAEGYYESVKYSFEGEELSTLLTVIFSKKENQSLNASLIYSFGFILISDFEDNSVSESLSMSSLVYSNNVLTSEGGVYVRMNHIDFSQESITGAITMKKI